MPTTPPEIISQGSPFTLSLLPPTQTGCDELIVRFGTEGKFKIDYVGFENNNFTHSINGTVHELTFSTVGLSAYNVLFSCFMNNKTLCNTDPIVIEMELELCGAIQQTNTVTINPVYNDHHDIELSQYETHRACIGGYSKFEVDINTGNELGCYRLTNTVATITVPGEFIQVFDHGNNMIPFTVVSSSTCETTVEYNIGNLEPLGGTIYHKFIVKNPCSCSNLYGMSMPSIQMELNGADPCGVVRTLPATVTNTVNSNCCTSGYSGTADFSKGVILGDNPFCASECIKHVYSLYSNFSDVPSDITNFTITDDLPPEVVITEMRMPSHLTQFDFDFCYQLNTNPGVDICKKIGVDIDKTFTIGPNGTPSNNHVVIPVGSQLSHFSWVCNDVIPAWYRMPCSFFAFFYIKDNVSAVSDNMAVFSSDLFNESVTRDHPDIVACEGSDFVTQCYTSKTQVVPGENLVLDIYITNYGDSEMPLGDLNIDLGGALEYVGPYNFDQNVGSQYVFQNNGNAISWTGLEIEPRCYGYDWVHLSIPVKVKYGMSSGPITVNTDLNGQKCAMHLFISEFFAVRDKVYYRCMDGTLTDSIQSVNGVDDVDLVYELINIGNLPIENIKMFAMKPSIGDISLGTGVARNSEVDLTYQPGVTEMSSRPMSVSYSNSVDPSNICQSSGSGSPSQSDIIIVHQGAGDQLTAGEKFSVIVPHSIDGSAQNGEKFFADFEYCIDVPSLNLSGKEYSSLNNLELEVDDDFQCSSRTCENYADFENRVNTSFTITTNNSVITITASGLLDTDYWTVAGQTGYLGGQGTYWGDQSIQVNQSSQPMDEICISIENYLVELDASSEQCNCIFLCKKIDLE